MDNFNSITERKAAILKLAQRFHELLELDDELESDLLEMEAKQIILDYCKASGYSVPGITLENNSDAESDLSEWLDDVDLEEKYVDTLTVERADVAELNYYFHSTFWPDEAGSLEEFIELIKSLLELDS